MTNRHLCEGDFFEQIHRIAQGGYYQTLILREKDLSEQEYKYYAQKVMEICRKNQIRCILHSFYPVAKELGCRNLHMPLPALERMSQRDRDFFDEIGASVHSVEQVRRAMQCGASYLVAGHIFETGCKPGLPPRGLDFLREVLCEVTIPVYGIGGITPQNEKAVMECGASGVCVMSGCMT